jgi:hypothetical protein
MFLQQAFRTSTLAAALLLVSTTSATAQPLPSASEVLAKHVAAIGGKDALRKLTSIKQTATMELPSMGMSAEMEMVMVAPNKLSTKVVLPGLGEMLTGTDGAVAWSVNPMQGPRLLEGKELEQIKEQADFLGNMLYEPDRFSTMANEGVVDWNGEKAYKIKLVRKNNGNERWEYFSLANGLQIGSESSVTTEMGVVESSSIISDYKSFGSIKVPTRAESTTGPQKIVMTTKTVELNTVDAKAVTAPDAVQPLIKK